MTAFRRGKRSYYWRRKRRQRRQRRSRRLLSRRRKLYPRRRTTTRIKRVIRYARSSYRKRRLPTRRYVKKQMWDNVLSSQRVKPTIRPYRNKVYHRKPSRVGRPRKKKHFTRTRTRFLQRKLKARVGRTRTKHTGTPVEKKVKRKPRYSDDEIFYSLANSSTPKATTEEKQSKKHSVRFNTPSNTKTKETESLSQEEQSCDSQQNQQTAIPKKRGRHSATPICKSR